MTHVTYSVLPIDGGWMVEAEPGEESFSFVAGSKAEAKARELAERSWVNDGVPAQVSIKLRDGSLLGRWSYGAEAAPSA
ncbi:MAG: DUF2188 domain-containing protein [Caulobacteraceae bacterium]